MSILQGSIIEGIVMTAAENFNSVPGLWQWNDARQRVDVVGGKVANWNDLSPQNNTPTRDLISGSPFYQTNSQGAGIWVMSDTSPLYLTSNRKDYNFLHNGSKFGIYMITKNDWSLAVPTAAFHLNFTNTVSTGLQGILNSATLGGRFGFTLRGGAAPITKQITNLLNPANSNFSPTNIIYTQSFVNFGQVNGVRITYGNATSTLTPFFPTLAEYPQGGNFIYQVCSGNTGMIIRIGLVLIYNWSNYTDSEVQVLDQRVLNLLAIEKTKFEQLDL